MLFIALIKRMARENPLWGAPRIHGELAKLGIAVAETSVAKYMPRRPPRRGPTWRTFPANEFGGIAAIDLLSVRTVSFQELDALVVLSLDQRQIVFVTATDHPTALWLAQQIREALPWDTAPRYLIRDNDRKYGHVFSQNGQGMWHARPPNRTTQPVAERIRRTRDWFYPRRASAPRHRVE